MEFHWSNHITQTSGTFPNVKYRYIPTLCNHCDNAPCVQNCPTTAMYKNDEGLTLHNPDKCIGCRLCQLSCPYGVIWFNKDAPHQTYTDDAPPAIKGGTFQGQELAQKVGAPIPYYNPARATTYAGVRKRGTVEKCRSAGSATTGSRWASSRPASWRARPKRASSATSTTRRARRAARWRSTSRRCCSASRARARTCSTSATSRADAHAAGALVPAARCDDLRGRGRRVSGTIRAR